MSFTSRLKELFIKAQNLVPQHQLSRVVGKVAASENPILKALLFMHLKPSMALIYRLLNKAMH